MKVDLTLLKKYIEELELELKVAEAVKSKDALSDEEANNAINARLISLSKAAGLCLGVSQEAGMLITDIQKLVSASFLPSKSSKSDLTDNMLSSFLKTYKGAGN